MRRIGASYPHCGRLGKSRGFIGMQDTYLTRRLAINRLTLTDAAFIQRLVNTPQWIRFIGDRHVHSLVDAEAYVKNLLSSPAIHYWVVRLRAELQPIGVVTLIRKAYLDHPDIGFAFLPEHSKKGYAFEAVNTVLGDMLQQPAHDQLLATTFSANVDSINLLTKLGFQYRTTIQQGDNELLLYGLSMNTNSTNGQSTNQ